MPAQRRLGVYDVRRELERHKMIPSSYHDALEQGLIITCTSFSRLSRSSARRGSNETRLQHKRKKANTVYLKVFDCDPHIFLPFILAVSPKYCESFNIAEFCMQHEEGHRLNLSIAAREILEEIAWRNGIEGNSHYRRLLEELFPEGPDKPSTDAEGETSWGYDASYLESLGTFGSRIKEATEICSDTRGELVTTVRAKLPRTNFQDGVFWLDVGFAHYFARTLFTRSRHLTLLDPNTSCEVCADIHSNEADEKVANSRTDEDVVTFTGAAIWAVFSIFPPNIWKAIETSQLRIWEKKQGIVNWTECVAMSVHRKGCQRGVIRLRLGFIESMHITKRIYAAVPAAH